MRVGGEGGRGGRRGRGEEWRAGRERGRGPSEVANQTANIT